MKVLFANVPQVSVPRTLSVFPMVDDDTARITCSFPPEMLCPYLREEWSCALTI